MNWRPLSRRGRADPWLDEPTEGLPPYLAGPLVDWLRGVFTASSGRISAPALQVLQLAFKLERPLDWRSDHLALEDLLRRVANDDEFGLDLIDYVLHHAGYLLGQHVTHNEVAGRAGALLRLGGSAWEVTTRDDGGGFQLSRRAVGPVREAIQDVPSSTRAHQHLMSAWKKLAGRSPDESAAYRDAIRAVEAVAKPVVLPASNHATLGTMIAAMRDKPDKWTTTLGTVDEVRRMMEAVWMGQLDRHGTDDESIPLNVSRAEADAAFAICLTLVRLFTGGHVRSAADA